MASEISARFTKSPAVFSVTNKVISTDLLAPGAIFPGIVIEAVPPPLLLQSESANWKPFGI